MNKRSWKEEFFGGTDINNNRLSWSGVVAGIFTFIAIFLTLSLITFAIGLSTFNPLSENPLKNVGTGVTIWTVITLVLSFAAGGFISGLVANKAGFLHGMMTWVTGIIILAFLTTTTIGSVAKVTGSAVVDASGKIASGTGHLITSSGDKVGDLITEAGENVKDINTDELDINLEKFLRDTDVKELQPNYLKNEFENSKEDIKEVGKNILLDPDSYEEELNKLFDKLEDREQTIENAIDKDAIAAAVDKNTELTEEEARIAVDNIYNEYQKALSEASETIAETKVSIKNTTEDIEVKFEEAKEDVREGADKAADIGSKSAMFLFIGLLLGLIISGYFGIKGANFLIM